MRPTIDRIDTSHTDRSFRAMTAEGYLFLAINGGPVISVPVRVDTGKIIMELWYGGLDASNCDPSNRTLIEGVLTSMLDQHAESTPTR